MRGNEKFPSPRTCPLSVNIPKFSLPGKRILPRRTKYLGGGYRALWTIVPGVINEPILTDWTPAWIYASLDHFISDTQCVLHALHPQQYDLTKARLNFQYSNSGTIPVIMDKAQILTHTERTEMVTQRIDIRITGGGFIQRRAALWELHWLTQLLDNERR